MHLSPRLICRAGKNAFPALLRSSINISQNILLISSVPSSDETISSPPSLSSRLPTRAQLHSINNSIGRFTHLLRTSAPSSRFATATISSRFPTEDEISKSIEISTRSFGETDDLCIVGIGSGAAADLACAIARFTNAKQLVLAPVTFGGCVAACASKEMIYDPIEARLVAGTGIGAEMLCHVAVDTSAIVPFGEGSTGVLDATLASTALALDEALKSVNGRNISVRRALLSSYKAWETICSGGHVSASLSEEAVAYVAIAAAHSGITSSPCSAPLAMASCLLPKYFPYGNFLSFVASTLPAIYANAEERGDSPAELVRDIMFSDKNTSEDDENKCESTTQIPLTSFESEPPSTERLVEWLSGSRGVPKLASMAYGTPEVQSMAHDFIEGDIFEDEATQSKLVNILKIALNR